ncbi:MAG: WD40/YVTN/BNR-like repeat-containing protein [Haloarculaceae archaeon]
MPTAYAALNDRLLVVDVEAETTTEALVDRDFECLAASPDAPERVFAGTVESGLLGTDDGGESWTTALETDDRVTAVTVSPHDSDVVWAGTEPSAVYRSTDGGASWGRRPGLTDLPSASSWSFPPRPHTHHVRWLEVAPGDPGRLYVAIEAGALVRTTDGGDTWRDRPEGARRDNHTLATHPDAPERVYTAAGDGYAESSDRGDTWTYPQAGLDHRYVWSVAVAPEDPDTVVVSAASGAHRAHRPDTAESYVYRRTGDGPFERVTDGLPDPTGTARAVLDAHESGFYAVTNRGPFRSADGARWSELAVSWPDAYRQQVPRGLAVV